MDIISGIRPTGQYGGNFTGSVDLSMLLSAVDATAPDIALVEFHESALTCWHSHPGGQTIWVVSGLARVGDDEQSVVIEPGALIYTPPGARHWHGAADGHDAQLLCLTWGITAWTDEVPSQG